MLHVFLRRRAPGRPNPSYSIRTSEASNEGRLLTFGGRHSGHQVAHFLPEARVQRCSAPGSLAPPDGGALFNQVLQARRKVFVSVWARVANLDQNYTHFSLDQRVVEPNLKVYRNIHHVLLKPSQFANKILGILFSKLLTCQSNSDKAAVWRTTGLRSVAAACETEAGVRTTIRRLLCCMRSSTSSRWSVRSDRKFHVVYGERLRLVTLHGEPCCVPHTTTTHHFLEC